MDASIIHLANLIDFAWFVAIIGLVFWPVVSIARDKTSSRDSRVAWSAMSFLSAPASSILAGALLPPASSHLWGLALPLVAVGPWSVLWLFRRRKQAKA